MLNRKLLVALTAICLFPVMKISAQPVTRVALIDIARIKETYFKDSKSFRDFEAKKTAIQVELDARKTEIKDLQQKQSEAIAAQNQELADQLWIQIRQKSDAYIQYGKEKSAELESEKALLFSSESFAKELYREIQRVAEKEGYSLVMDRQRAADLQLVVWSSPTVDITDKVIENLDKLRAE